MATQKDPKALDLKAVESHDVKTFISSYKDYGPVFLSTVHDFKLLSLYY